MADIERGQVTLTDSTPKMQTVQVEVWGSDDVRDDVEHFEPFGLTARPADADSSGGPDALVAVLGDADHSVVVAVADRRYRITGLAKGDVCVYDARGQVVRLTTDGIDVTPASGKYVRILGTDVRLADDADASLAKWSPGIKTFLQQFLLAVASAKDSLGEPLVFSTPLPSLPTDSVAGTTRVTGK